MASSDLNRNKTRWLLAAAGVLLQPSTALATDGSDVLLVIDPTDPVSLVVGHYYQNARGVPDNQVVYMPIATSPYLSFREFQLPAIRAVVDQRDLDLLIDYIVLAPSTTFFNAVPNTFVDSCSPVSRFSITSAYSSLYLDDVFAAGNIPILYSNPFGGSASPSVVPFEGIVEYANGFPNANGSRVLISSLLGYTGVRGNTVQEILDMIDRSVAADGTHPAGTVYYMQTTDAARSGPRHGTYPNAVSELQALGDDAEHLFANLPIGRHDALGVMSGFASTNIDQADFTLLPGAFADHLTSFAATFDTSAQTKASEWIRKGASGTFGTVQEPCNYPNKFPHARAHLFYHQGLPLGAAAFRSLRSFPVQGLLLGDPLTSPFDTAPSVAVSAAPGGPGTVSITMAATTTKPGVPNPAFGRMFVDGVFSGIVLNNASGVLNTSSLADGWHEVVVSAVDASPVRSSATDSVAIVVSNLGRFVEIAQTPSSVALDEAIEIDARVLGPHGASELRVLQNGRTVVTGPGRQSRLIVPANLLGEGDSRVQIEAVFADGMRVRSEPLAITVTAGTPNAAPSAPRAFTVSELLTPDLDVLLELPFATDGEMSQLTFEVLQAPAQASINTGSGGAAVMATPDSGATGLDRLVYRVTGPGGTAEGLIRISYDGAWPDDRNGDGSVDTDDLYAQQQNPVDLNADGVADQADLVFLEQMVRAELPINR